MSVNERCGVNTWNIIYAISHLLFWNCCCRSCIPGNLDKAYSTLCELEISQGGKNPGVKTPFNDVCQSIRDLACRFTNQMAIVKTHFKKPAACKAKARGKAKTAPAIKPKDEKTEENLDGEEMDE